MPPQRKPDSLQIVLEAFERAAAAGAPAPTNHDLSLMLGQSSVSGPVPYVKELERRGLIRVERFHRERRVTILATGQQTWADPRELKPGRWSGIAPAVAAAPEPLPPPRLAPVAAPESAPLGIVPPFRPFGRQEADAFADALAEGFSIEEAARHAGRSLLDGYRQFHAVCAELGEAAR